MINRLSKKIKKHKYLLALIILILLLELILYKDFIFGKRIYIYTDIAADTWVIHWPYYKDIISNIKALDLKTWSFNIGIGTSTFTVSNFIFDPFNIILIMFPIKYLHYGMLLASLLKILLSGILFYLYIKKLKVNELSALVSSLIWSFNSYMIIWGQQYHFATMIVLFTLILLSVEHWFQNSKWVFMTISVALLSINGVYWIYDVSIYMFIYYLFRYFIDFRFYTKHFIKHISKFTLSYICGIALSAIVFLPSSYVIVTSPRVSDTPVKIPLFTSPIDYFTIIMKIFSNDILGIGSEYFGYVSYYHILLFSSLIVLLLIPQLKDKLTKKHKILFVLGSLLLICTLIFPFFSFLFNGFKVLYYRWTFMLIFSSIVIMAKALSFVSEGNLNFPLLIKTFVLLATLILSCIVVIVWKKFIVFNKQDIMFIIRIIFLIILFLLVYITIFYLFTTKINKIKVQILFILVVCIELVVSNYPAINFRGTITPDYIISRQGYFDSTNDAVKYINNVDKDFYRVHPMYYSVSYNDSLFQDFKGVRSYYSLNNPSYINLLNDMQIPLCNEALHYSLNYIKDLDNNFELYHLLGVRYILNKDKSIQYFGYNYINSFDDVSIFKNNYYLPLGFTYDSYISKQEFDKLSKQQKDNILFKAFVYNDKNRVEGLNKFSVTSLNNDQYKEIKINRNEIKFSNISVEKNEFPKELEYRALNDDPQIILNVNEKYKDGIELKFNLASAKSMPAKVYYKSAGSEFKEVNSVWFAVAAGQKDYEINLDATNISDIRIDLGITNSNFRINNLNLYSIDRRDNIKDINKLKESSLNIEKYNDTYIKGNISLDKSKMLCLSIPFDKGWKIKVDGKEKSTEEVNLGLLGIKLDKGYHNIEIYYEHPYLKVGMIITTITVIIMMIVYSKLYKKFKILGDIT